MSGVRRRGKMRGEDEEEDDEEENEEKNGNDVSDVINNDDMYDNREGD